MKCTFWVIESVENNYASSWGFKIRALDLKRVYDKPNVIFWLEQFACTSTNVTLYGHTVLGFGVSAGGVKECQAVHVIAQESLLEFPSVQLVTLFLFYVLME